MPDETPAIPVEALRLPAAPAGFQLRRLGQGDVMGGLRLSCQAGWNQTQYDWEMILNIGICHGLFREGRLVATTATLQFGRIDWVAMVLVDEEQRRQGLGTFLLKLHLDLADQRGATAALDASELGLELYQKQGFKEACRLTRYLLEPSKNPFDQSAYSEGFVPSEVAALDAEHIRLQDRRALFEAVQRQHRQTRSFSPFGFACFRPGQIAPQIGPLIAPDLEVARICVSKARHGGAGLLIDVPDFQKEFRGLLEEMGFLPKRSFVRMLRGQNPQSIRPSENVFAVAGPELG